MKLLQTLPVILAASANAAKFLGFSDTACQKYDGTYVALTGPQLQDIVAQKYEAQIPLIPEASRYFDRPGEKETCPSNSDDTYKWASHIYPSRPVEKC
jgi:hypothetical protein